MWDKLKLVVVLVILGTLVGGAMYIRHLQGQNNALRLEKDSIVQVNETTIAVLAQTTNQLEDAAKVASELRAQLVAAARIVLTPDTVSITDTVEVELLPDSTRIARVNQLLRSSTDSSVVGTLVGTITAPPCCANIFFSFDIIPKPIDLTVSLARTDNNRAFFAVTYPGGTVEVSAPFARLPVPEPWASAYVAGMYNLNNSFQARLSGEVRLIKAWGIYGVGELSQDFTEGATPQMYFGLKKRL